MHKAKLTKQSCSCLYGVRTLGLPLSHSFLHSSTLLPLSLKCKTPQGT